MRKRWNTLIATVSTVPHSSPDYSSPFTVDQCVFISLQTFHILSTTCHVLFAPSSTKFINLLTDTGEGNFNCRTVAYVNMAS